MKITMDSGTRIRALELAIWFPVMLDDTLEETVQLLA